MANRPPLLMQIWPGSLLSRRACLPKILPVTAFNPPAHPRRSAASLNGDLIVSVLESANKRDARSYFQKYVGHRNASFETPGPQIDLPRTIRDRPLFIQGANNVEANYNPGPGLHVAIVKICHPQTVDDLTMEGVARTLSQLRTLGLLSIIILDCGQQSTLDLGTEQANRLAILLGKFDKHNAIVLENNLIFDTQSTLLWEILNAGRIPVIHEYLSSYVTGRIEKLESESMVVALVKLLDRLTPSEPPVKCQKIEVGLPSVPLACIESIIVLDPVGGIPMKGETSMPHRFVNLRQEYDTIMLTDERVDLSKLTYLIEDSFNRKLDVDDYLRRVNDKIAGLIIAGDYEGVAILTWEKPRDLSQEEAYKQHRLIPYLDKFAVLKSRQGSGGVADIVFNAMVQDYFGHGVCWRSRADNPVNKWYFERSVGGTKRLHGSSDSHDHATGLEDALAV
ncbi:Amino-acid N-acetyltransferase [Scedosporium apiospermum]|uniref:Amino-acid acetyltransferase, mitochondrial n=1 Tax=Pseudallescheria apiosperma TaxID=563466 RepID=A0A084G0V8_PSEDA|nr:Amino-acid N-acetyltransferase [Scedosporium apiospermum]KEZ40970.1 Amino-acid N-acetyltransferase [Scedosporium apiospermum]